MRKTENKRHWGHDLFYGNCLFLNYYEIRMSRNVILVWRRISVDN